MEPVGGDPRVLEQALEFTRRGIPVIPVGINKRPRSIATWKERQETLPTLDQIRREFSKPTVVGYGVIMGHLAAARLRKGSCMFGLDFEAAVSYGRFLIESALDQDALLVVESGGGGRHVWSLSGTEVGNAKLYDRETGEHVGDIKGEGGYLIGPESLHKSGRRYRWISKPKSVQYIADFWSWFTPILERLGWTTEMPSGGADSLLPDDDSEFESGQTADLLAQECREGGRHDTLVKIVGYLRNTVDQSHALAIALLWNKDRCVPSLPPHEVIETVRDLYARYPDPPRLIVKNSRDWEPEEEQPPALSAVIPEACLRGWVGEYITIMAPTTEAPDAYHLGCALVSAGMVFGRSVYNRYARRIYPNVYAVLIGSSGRTRKDTAMARAFEVMQPVVMGTTVPHVLDTVASAEGLLERMGKQSKVLLALSEMSILLRNARREGTNNIIPYLTRLFDCPDVMEVPSRKNPVVVNNPFLSILGCTTPEWFASDITEDDIRGGFAGRFLYLTGEPKSPVANPPPPDSTRLFALRTRLHQIAQAHAQRGSVEFPLSSDAEAWWEHFYLKEFDREYIGDFGVLSQRVPLYVRKIALIYAALDGAEAITSDHLESGAAVVRLSQEYIRVSYTTWGASADAKLQEKMRKAVHDAGCVMEKRELHQRLSGRVKANDFKSALALLLAMGQLQIVNGRIECGHRERRNGHEPKNVDSSVDES